ncbi:MAG: GTPase HflX [Burkholderiales bacterium]|nr:MAG: GTPase HflX [Burkholderiales bacterium]
MSTSAPHNPALLVGASFGRDRRGEDALEELEELATSAGFTPVERFLVHRSRPDAALFIGSGKASELRAELERCGAASVLFDNALSAVQERNLEQHLGVPVADRTELILEIFARRARSHEGKLQVELARLEHLSSRLVRGWTHLERQKGGIGLRGGPGEKQIELDRRMIDNKVRQLHARLERMERQRRTQRRARERNRMFTVSLVGYTNAGKSTLFNRLAGAGTYAADQLFATLDTLTRRIELAPGEPVTISDTVGFIRDLPHQLVEAFKATLEETVRAELLLHVIDASAPNREAQAAEVRRVLAEIGAGDLPVIEVWNKLDLTGLAPGVLRDECGTIRRVSVSALKGAGIDSLRMAIRERRIAWTAAHAGPVVSHGSLPRSEPDRAERFPSPP